MHLLSLKESHNSPPSILYTSQAYDQTMAEGYKTF